jgi:ABC-type polysaccharide/polyol phosphate export permease
MMNFQRLWAMFVARNREFFRDRSALGWNFIFPFLIVIGFGVIFGGRDYSSFKVGVFPVLSGEALFGKAATVPLGFQQSAYLEFVRFESFEEGVDKLQHHKIDFLIKRDSPDNEYWMNDSSPKGYVVEKIYKASFLSPDQRAGVKGEVQGYKIRYIDWLFPGILGMNMMFSALWGVGYVVVRYRKNGVLKRLKATPLTALEYLTAQMMSRIFLLMFTLVVVWVGSDLIFSFRVEGSYLDLLVVFFLGGLSLAAMGLLLAARGMSEEFTSGILNFISWPMMFLSEVWFSLEGAPQWVKNFAQVFPLTHMIRAARHIMNDGATLANVGLECTVLILFSVICLVTGALLFSWNK